LLLCSALAGLPQVKQYPMLDLFQTIRGAQLPLAHGEPALLTFAAPLPWLALGFYALVAIGLVFAACSITVNRDF
jgi:hypothetical protein